MAFGIPPLLNRLNNVAATVGLLVADAALVLSLFSGRPKWGIYKDNRLVIVVDNVIGFEYKKDMNVADYPMEDGAFQSYNKVDTAYLAKVRMTRGGNNSTRQAFLNQLDAAAASLDLYDVVTPEKTYLQANVSRVDYSRTAQSGVGLITAEVWLVQIRVTVQKEFSSTEAASGASPVNGGTVQTQPPTAVQSAAAEPVIEGH